LDPNQVRYQAALLTEKHCLGSFLNCITKTNVTKRFNELLCAISSLKLLLKGCQRQH
jgi:hypothetical protein